MPIGEDDGIHQVLDHMILIYEQLVRKLEQLQLVQELLEIGVDQKEPHDTMTALSHHHEKDVILLEIAFSYESE